MSRIMEYTMLKHSFLLALAITVLSTQHIAAERIVLVSSDDTKASFYGKWLELIYTEVFHRLGYEFQYRGYPGGRAPILAENGEVDGEIHRAAEYEKSVKNLIKVPEPSFLVRYGAYAAKPGIALHGWESLRNTSYSVEYKQGAQIPGIALAEVVKPENLSTITTVEQGLKKLILGRTDLYVDQEIIVVEELLKLAHGAYDPSIVYLAGILWTGESYVYLNKKHAALAKKIAETLIELKKEGLIEAYRKKIEASLSP